MKRRVINRTASAFMIAAVITIVGIAVSRRRRRSRPHSVAEVEIPDVAMSDDLRHLVTLLNTIESEDDPRYLGELEQLRERSVEVIAEARRLLGSAAGNVSNNFSLRHSVVLAVAALRDPKALDLLSEVALNPQPLPPVEAPLSTGLFGSHPEHELNTETTVQGDDRGARCDRRYRSACRARPCPSARCIGQGIDGLVQRSVHCGLDGAGVAT